MSVLDAVVGWFAPSLCVGCQAEGNALCTLCAELEIVPFGERCWNCSALSPRCLTCKRCRGAGGPRCVWIATDYANLAKETVQKYKFEYHRAASKPLSRLMTKTLLSFIDAPNLEKANYLIVPVPTASQRIRQRGFDHSALLTKQVALILGAEYSNALARVGQNRQVGTRREERFAQANRSYVMRKPRLVKDRNILLIDDVVTTGATLQACSQLLRAAGARHVDALIFAKRL